MSTITCAHVIGAGGTGGHLIAPLARLLQHHQRSKAQLQIHDGDSFELKNTTRQLCSTDAIGINKAEWLSVLCAHQGLTVTAVPHYLDAKALRHTLREAGPGVTLIVAAVDNDATRKMCLDALEAHSGEFFFISPGNTAADDPAAAIKGNVHWWGYIDGTTYGLNPALVEPNLEHPQDAIPRSGGCLEQQASSPQLITANALAAALTLTVIQNLLDDLLPKGASSCFFNGRSFALSAS